MMNRRGGIDGFKFHHDEIVDHKINSIPASSFTPQEMAGRASWFGLRQQRRSEKSCPSSQIGSEQCTGLITRKDTQVHKVKPRST
jgi:hypothetical protein